eukprot:scaffold1947_cov207-Prasinococcus_capsulatus_cf.AAC.9
MRHRCSWPEATASPAGQRRRRDAAIGLIARACKPASGAWPKDWDAIALTTAHFRPAIALKLCAQSAGHIRNTNSPPESGQPVHTGCGTGGVLLPQPQPRRPYTWAGTPACALERPAPSAAVDSWGQGRLSADAARPPACTRIGRWRQPPPQPCVVVVARRLAAEAAGGGDYDDGTASAPPACRSG